MPPVSRSRQTTNGAEATDGDRLDGLRYTWQCPEYSNARRRKSFVMRLWGKAETRDTARNELRHPQTLRPRRAGVIVEYVDLLVVRVDARHQLGDRRVHAGQFLGEPVALGLGLLVRDPAPGVLLGREQLLAVD
jgi:hypothetical protein